MACSKIFSDLPEVAINIMQHLHNDIKSLYSCVLVNKVLCHLAIPLLWKDPFSIKYRGYLTCHFIDTYLLFLNDNDKNKIEEIKFDSNLHKPLFNYPSFIKTLNLLRVQLHVLNWINSTTCSTSSVQQFSNKKSYFQLPLMNESQEELNIIFNNFDNAKIKSICIILLKIFIENNATLTNLHATITPYCQNHFFNYAYEMILNNPTLVSDIEQFTCHLLTSDEYIRPETFSRNLEEFQEFLSSLPSYIKHIEVCYERYEFNIREIYDEFAKIIRNTIQSQSQLSSIKFKYSSDTTLLNSLKYSSNTLTSINFCSYYFTDDMRFDALSSLTKLESLQFKDCDDSLNSKILQPLLDIATPLKIRTLVMISIYGFKINQTKLLIQKIGFYVENLVLSIYDDELRREVFDTIIDFCENIKFLHLKHIKLTNISQLSKMVSNFNNLKYLTLEIEFFNYHHCFYNFNFNNNEIDLNISSMILKELSKSFTPSLYYLDLNLVINPDDLQVLLENCKLKKLLIRNKSVDNLDTTLNVIKEFVIKEKNLEFLSYSIREHPECHKRLEQLAKEIQSFVRIMNYNDLVVKVSDIDGNLEI